jgi:CubicO group peptidase (beta-lactamase class C family)
MKVGRYKLGLAALGGAAAGALLLVAIPVRVEAQDPAQNRAIAAGYKASFLCSNLFNGGADEAQTARDELSGTYGELNPIFPALEARVDRTARTVSVPFSDGLPPRVAAWRPNLGCAQLPIGTPPAAAATLPRMDLEAPALDARPWPMGDRDTVGRLAGDRRALHRAVERAFDRRSFGQGSETTAVIVVQDSRIVAERYRNDWNMHMTQRTWSVAKSMAAAVIGAAAQQGRIDIDAPAPLPEWQREADPRRLITTDQLLRMASGLSGETAGNRTDDLYFGGASVANQAAYWPIGAPPGTRFRYANNDTVLAIRGLQHALGDDEVSRAFPFTELLWKIGMTRTFLETDWRGHFILSSQVWTTARDLARFGLLHQSDGVWEGERILPAGWISRIRAHGPAQPPSGYGYGTSWWTFPSDAGIPDDAFAARGNRGQFVVVVPSRRLVIVRRGFDGAGMGFELDPFVREVLAALE